MNIWLIWHVGADAGAEAVVDEASVEQIMVMGFTRAQAARALAATSGSVPAALDWIFSRVDELDAAEPAPGAAPPAPDRKLGCRDGPESQYTLLFITISVLKLLYIVKSMMIYWVEIITMALIVKIMFQTYFMWCFSRIQIGGVHLSHGHIVHGRPLRLPRAARGTLGHIQWQQGNTSKHAETQLNQLITWIV